MRSSLEALTKKKKRKSSTSLDGVCYQIGQYVSIDGPTVAVKKFKKTHPHLKFGESTSRCLRTKYYNYGHNILIIFDVLPNSFFTTSETRADY